MGREVISITDLSDHAVMVHLIDNAQWGGIAGCAVIFGDRKTSVGIAVVCCGAIGLNIIMKRMEQVVRYSNLIRLMHLHLWRKRFPPFRERWAIIENDLQSDSEV